MKWLLALLALLCLPSGCHSKREKCEACAKNDDCATGLLCAPTVFACKPPELANATICEADVRRQLKELARGVA